jgi:hypothetical protein
MASLFRVHFNYMHVSEDGSITRMATEFFVPDEHAEGSPTNSITSSPSLAVEKITVEIAKSYSKAKVETEETSRDDHTNRPLISELLSNSKLSVTERLTLPSNVTNTVAVPLTSISHDGGDVSTTNITLTDGTTLVVLTSRFNDGLTVTKVATPNITEVYGHADNVTDAPRLHFQSDSSVTEIRIPDTRTTGLNDSSTVVMTSQSMDDVMSAGRNSAFGDEQRTIATESFNSTTAKYEDRQPHPDSVLTPGELDYTNSTVMVVQLEGGMTGESSRRDGYIDFVCNITTPQTTIIRKLNNS